jgi:hypothetical protein
VSRVTQVICWLLVVAGIVAIVLIVKGALWVSAR